MQTQTAVTRSTSDFADFLMNIRRNWYTTALLYGPTVGMYFALANGVIENYAMLLPAVGLVALVSLCVLKSKEQRELAFNVIYGVIFPFAFHLAVFYYTPLIETGSFRIADK